MPDDPESNFTHLTGFVRQLTACQSSLYAYICALLGTSGGAADVLQETNVVLWQKAAEYDADRPFGPWAFRFAHFQVMAYRKRQSRDRLVYDDRTFDQVSDALRRRDDSADRELSALDDCLGKLPVRHREVVDARYRHEEPVEAIAARLGKAANAVAAELYRIRKSLHDCIHATLAREAE